MSILVIEDEWDQLTIIEDTFKANKIELLLADNGGDALDFLENRWEDIDLIITDILLPENDQGGAKMEKEVCYQIGKKVKEKNEGAVSPKPLILMSVYSNEIVEEFREKTGIKEADFFRKPFDVDRLVERVKNLLGGA